MSSSRKRKLNGDEETWREKQSCVSRKGGLISDDDSTTPLEDDENFRTHLFIGNVDSSDSQILFNFLDSALKTLELLEDNSPSSRSIVIRIEPNTTWGRVHFLNCRDATATLRLDEIPFMGKRLRIQRPKGWIGPDSLKKSHTNWRDKLERHITAAVDDVEHNNNACEAEKTIIVKGLGTSRLTLKLDKYLSSIMKQIGFVKQDKEPIKSFRKLKDGVLKFHNSNDARNILMLQDIPFHDTHLTFLRKQDGKGDATMDCIKTWNESFYEFFNRERDVYYKDFKLSKLKTARLHKTKSNKNNVKMESRFNTELVHFENERLEMKDQLKIIESQLSESIAWVKELENEIDERKKQETYLQEDIRLKDSQLVESNARAELLHDEINERKIDQRCLGVEISSKDEQISTLKATFQTYELKLASMEMLIEESKKIDQSTNHVKNESDSFRSQIEEQDAELSIKKNRIEELERATEKGIQNQNDVKKELDSLRINHNAELHTKSKRIQELERLNERQTERIMNLTDALLAEGDKQRKLDSALDLERERRKNLQDELKNKGRSAPNPRLNAVKVEEEKNVKIEESARFSI